MPLTRTRSRQIEDGGITRDDLNVVTSTQAVIRRAAPGVGIILKSTGVDSGTGDVTVTLGDVIQIDGTDYTTLATDGVLEVTTGSADRTITIPVAQRTVGRLLIIKKMDSGNGGVILSAGSEYFDASQSPCSLLAAIYDAVLVLRVTGKWLVFRHSTGGGGGGAPTDATYWVRTAHSGLSNEIVLGDGASVAHTTDTTRWNAQTGTARQVVVWGGSGPVWAYLESIDILEPAQITFLGVRPAGSYPDGLTSIALVAASGTDTPQFQAIYLPNSPTALSIDIQSHTYGGARTPEVNPSDYPDTTWSDYARSWESSQAINRGQAVGESIVFLATATVGGVPGKTRSVNLIYYNERMWGKSSEAAIDTETEIDAFYAANSKEISNSRSKTWNITLGAGEYGYFIVRTALGDPTFYIYPQGGTPGLPGGMSKVGSAVSWDNVRGFRENFDVWRTDNSGLGAITIQS